MALSGFLTSAAAVLAVSFAAPESHRSRFAFWTASLITAGEVLAYCLLPNDLLYSWSILIAAVGIAAVTLWIARKRRPASILATFYACPYDIVLPGLAGVAGSSA
jgi:nicotinamide riboside transporter PnuC